MDRGEKPEELEKRVRELEEELRIAKKESDDANRKKTMFLANMSHEIRTPMNSIIGIHSLLSQTKLTDEQKDLLEIINIASHNLLAIINDILDLSRIESGLLKLDAKPFFLHDEIFQVIKLLSLKAKGKGIELFSRIESTVPTCVTGDAIRLKQILINLANNGIKFTNEGHVVIAVESIDPGQITEEKEIYIPEHVLSGKLKSDQILLKFEVSDTGIGISEGDQKTLFNEFAQLENALVREYEGTGLGLSISLNLTRLMNGKMGVTSMKGKGSTFWFTIVFEKSDESVLRQLKEVELKKSKKFRPLSILIVEDNLLNQKFAVTTLKKEGHKVDIAENGRIALEKFRNNQYDLILMDIAMPIMDGMEASRAIRKLEEEVRKSEAEAKSKKPVKIVAITAYVMVTDKDKCLDAGMDDYLAKPYRPNDLIRIIDSLDIY
jgi:signal transduction histidine kinase/ActR/RegA family two-component response regulator